MTIVNSKTICDSFKLNESSPKFFLLQNILPCELFDKSHENNFNHDKDEFSIGIVGRLDPVKRHDVFLKIAKRLLNVKKKINFLIFGNGPMLKHIDQGIKDLGHPGKVHLHTNKNDIDDIYNSFDIFLLTSDSEGFSNAIMEAMMYGKPCVVTDVGGNPDIIDHNKNGFLFPKQDSVAASKIILDLIENKKIYNEISENASKYIRQYFNPYDISQSLLNKYISILQKTKSSKN